MIVTATQEVCAALGGASFAKLESPSLRLDKFVRVAEKRDNEHLKKDEIDAVVACQKRHGQAVPPLALPNGASLVMKLGGRLIVNQAGGVLENAGLCLHRHFGCPYLPGSAVKGGARHVAWCRWNDAEAVDQKRLLALRLALTFGYPTGDGMPRREEDRTRDASAYLDDFLAAEFPDLFVDNGRRRAVAGSVAFLPAVPRGQARLVTEIVNCHHKDYYAGKQDRATDDESPNPQFFPAVEAGASFVFMVAPVRGRAEAVARVHGFEPVEFAMQMLREAVELFGLGAKTAAGYGWFEEDPADVKTRRIAELEASRQAEQLAQQREAEERRQRLEKEREAEQAAREAAEQARQAAFLTVAQDATLDTLPPDAPLRAFTGRVKLILLARQLTDAERDVLRQRLVAAFGTMSGKDARKLLDRGSGKGKELWRDLRKWLGDERVESLAKEVGAQ